MSCSAMLASVAILTVDSISVLENLILEPSFMHLCTLGALEILRQHLRGNAYDYSPFADFMWLEERYGGVILDI